MKPAPEATLEDRDAASELTSPLPGVVVIVEGGRPTLRAVALGGQPVVLGREPGLSLTLEDGRTSRRHTEVTRGEGRWCVRDLGSRNGTYVQGVRAEPLVLPLGDAVVRLGASLALLREDVRPYLDATVTVEPGKILGPMVKASLSRVEVAARAGRGVLVIAESGVGKELAARVFHEATGRTKGPFVAVNCAAIPEGVAERLLFGAVKGAFSGATADSRGYLEAADRGTLFLDEMGELDLAVQAKILRVLETREVLPLGALRPRPVDLRLCCATHRDLRRAVVEGRFRADLYYRIAQPEVRLRPLRERVEELPWFITATLAEVAPALTADIRLFEACALRPWPGNVRELLASIRDAGHEALTAGATTVTPEWLPALAGQALGPEEGVSETPASPPRASDEPAITRELVEEALAQNKGNVAAAARTLKLHRTQLYRYLQRFGISVQRES